MTKKPLKLKEAYKGNDLKLSDLKLLKECNAAFYLCTKDNKKMASLDTSKMNSISQSLAYKLVCKIINSKKKKI